jgi:hypothetical protein
MIIIDALIIAYAMMLVIGLLMLGTFLFGIILIVIGLVRFFKD